MSNSAKTDTCPKCGAEMTIYIDDVHPQPAHTTDSTECQLNQASARIAKLEQMILPLEEAVCGRDVEIERLRAVVDKLPRYASGDSKAGQPFVFGVDEAWVGKRDSKFYSSPEAAKENTDEA